jgi:hypothetical protein
LQQRKFGCSAFIQKLFWVMTFENMQAKRIEITLALEETMASDHKPVVKDKNFVLREVSPFGRPQTIFETSDSACVLVNITDKQQIMLVRQKREAMVRPTNPDGIITECLAGRFDKDETPSQLIHRESAEEAGISVKIENIEPLNQGYPMALSAGCLTELSYLMYVEITSNQMEEVERTFGLADEGEEIIRVFISYGRLETFVCEDARVFGMIQWFKNRLLEQKIDELTRMIESATATTGRE